MQQDKNAQTVPDGDQTGLELVSDDIVSNLAGDESKSSLIATSRSIVTMSDTTVQRVKLLAEMLATSSFNNSRNTLKSGDYFLIMLKGLAVGLDPIIAVDFISVIQGKPVIDGKGLLALILNAKKSGEVEDIVIDSHETRCTVTIKRKGMTAHTETFSMDDASRLGLTSRDAWQKQPRTMLKWRAVAACARACCADIIGGLYSKEEIADEVIVMEDGTMQLPASAPKPAQNGASRTSRPRPSSSATINSTNGTNGAKPIITPNFSTGESPKSDEPDPNDPEDIRHAIPIYGAEHWYVKNYEAFVSQLRPYIKDEKGMPNHEVSSTGLRLIGKPTWKDFESGKTAIEAVHQKVNANKPAPKPATNWHGEFEDWLWTWFDMTRAIWEERTGSRLADYPALEDAITATKTIALRDGWDVLVTEAKYVKEGRQTYIEFQGVFGVRMYGRSTTFKSQVGEGYYTRIGAEQWQAGELYDVGYLRVSWKRNENGLLIAHTVQVVEDDAETDSGLTAEEIATMAF